MVDDQWYNHRVACDVAIRRWPTTSQRGKPTAEDPELSPTGRTLLLLGLLLTGASSAHARTWRVEKNGSGDFTVIQAAVDAAAAGDTVAVGPGRFTEKAPFTRLGWTEDVYVAITKDNIVLIGSGQDVTIIGPATPEYAPTAWPKGIAAIELTQFAVQNLTVENTRDGVYNYLGHLDVNSCTIRNCYSGVLASPSGGMLLNDCRVLGNGTGVLTFGPAQAPVVQNCFSQGNGYGVAFANGTLAGRVTQCEFHDDDVGVQISDSSSGEVANCRFTDIAIYALVIAFGIS